VPQGSDGHSKSIHCDKSLSCEVFVSDELREALTAAGASPFIQKVIDPVLVEMQRRYSPLLTAIPAIPWDTDVFNFNQRTSVATGGAVVDGGTLPVSTSAYLQNSFQMKHFMTVGAVTGYATQVARVISSLRQTEIEGSIQGQIWDIETSVVWGNSAATVNGAAPLFDGLDVLVSNFTGSAQNSIDKAGASFSLSHLDELIDAAETNAAMPIEQSPWMFLMSSTANSKISQLMVNQQRFMGEIEVAAGLKVPSYRGVPLVKSSFLSPRGMSMGTVAVATAATGGALAAGQYFYKLTPVIARQGELLPSAEVNVTATGGASVNTLSFAIPTGLDGSQPILYKVYRSTTTGTESLLGCVDARVGTAADGVTPIMTTSILDTGTALVPANGGTVPANPPAAYCNTNAGAFPPIAGSESVYLLAQDPNLIVRPYVRHLEPLDVAPTIQSPDTLPYALVSDTTFAIKAPKFLAKLTRTTTSV
jgi:hypothetical protein